MSTSEHMTARDDMSTETSEGATGGERRPRHRVSAAELGNLLGESLPTADSVSAAELALVDAARTLLNAIVRSAVDDEERLRLAKQIERITEDLRAKTRDDLVRLVRHPDGRIENLAQAAAGRCNPRSLRLRFDDMSLPPPDRPPTPVEVRGWCELDATAAGPPERAHGGIVATILDEALGVAMMKAGRTGMTVSLEVSLLAGVPLEVPLEVRSRCVDFDGRKTRATAELVVDDKVLARGAALFVASR